VNESEVNTQNTEIIVNESEINTQNPEIIMNESEVLDSQSELLKLETVTETELLEVLSVEPQRPKKKKKKKSREITVVPTITVETSTEFPSLISEPHEPLHIDNDLKPTYAEIARIIPENLKSSAETNRLIQWIKMNVPNITGIYISKEITCTVCLHLWKTLLRRPNQGLFCEEFFQFQNVMLERYDFLRRKDIEYDPYFKKTSNIT